VADSAFSPERMAECGLPFIPAIEGELVLNCDLCVTTPTLLFDPFFPMPPSFDYGCYALVFKKPKKLLPGEPDDEQVKYHATLSGEVKFVNQGEVGFCSPSIETKWRPPTYGGHAWDCCNDEDIPWFNMPPDLSWDRIVLCCDGAATDCLTSVSTEMRGSVDQWNPDIPCYYVKLVIADKSYSSPFEDLKAGAAEDSKDMTTEFGFAEVAFSKCNVALDVVCDVLCDETTLVVAYRRLYFQKGILIKVDTYDDGREFKEDETFVDCTGGEEPC
jgi:hypothetical protein